jgi:uncharacterized protein YdcH (DUF465 family)
MMNATHFKKLTGRDEAIDKKFVRAESLIELGSEYEVERVLNECAKRIN